MINFHVDVVVVECEFTFELFEESLIGLVLCGLDVLFMVGNGYGGLCIQDL